jgi:GAF domain-containing protein
VGSLPVPTIVDSLADWATQLKATAELREGQAEGICRLCVAALGVTGGGISLVTAVGNRGIVCATDDLAKVIEDLQFTMGQGPCLEAAQGDAPVLIDDVAQERDRHGAAWPVFMATLSEQGVGGLFAFPLRIGSVSVGAMDLYRRTPGALTEAELAGALMAADAAALALLSLEIAADGSLSGSDDDAYDMVVHQATGMVRVQLSVSAADALLILRARAFAMGQGVSQTARDVVARRLRFGQEDR